jgi:adenine-specific DNA-methyltransferase
MSGSIARTLSSAVVYTPLPVASALVTALQDRSGARWLDPCVGAGAFVRALHDQRVDPTRIVALDIAPTSAVTDELADTRRGIDFCAWDDHTDTQFDRVVCNPPFISLHRLPEPLRALALNTTLPDGSKIRLRSNYWVAFLCRCLRRLNTGGSLGFILPASWDNADYAASLRERLPRLFRQFDTFRVNARLFGDVQDGCVVIIGRGYREPHAHSGRLECASVEALVSALAQGVATLSDVPSPALTCPGSAARKQVAFGTVADILLGGVTGDSRYFLMTDSERRARRLPQGVLRPVLTKAHHLNCSEVGKREWKIHLAADERVWLFDPPPSSLRHPFVKRYLELDEAEGGCRKTAFKVRRRKAWYRVPVPARADGFLSGMSRHGPWIALRTMPRLAATNTLYVVRFREDLSPEHKAAWALSLLSSRTRAFAAQVGRIYADGLLKYEPNDLASLPVSVPSRTTGARGAYAKAIDLLLGGHHDAAALLADRWLST